MLEGRKTESELKPSHGWSGGGCSDASGGTVLAAADTREGTNRLVWRGERRGRGGTRRAVR